MTNKKLHIYKTKTANMLILIIAMDFTKASLYFIYRMYIYVSDMLFSFMVF